MMLPSENTVQIWSIALTIAPNAETTAFDILSEDEQKRALRFHFSEHKRRFIAARSMLRYLLGYYLGCSPQCIEFTYNHFGKPNIAHPTLRFNVSHSHELAVFAFTSHHDIGIDIERIVPSEKDKIAARFFSLEENIFLQQLENSARLPAFYQLWARKEALIKAIGKGLSFSLKSFSVHDTTSEIITLENIQWSLRSFVADPNYAAALATNQPIQSLEYWEWQDGIARKKNQE